jgi:hypothetical protein
VDRTSTSEIQRSRQDAGAAADKSDGLRYGCGREPTGPIVGGVGVIGSLLFGQLVG